MLCSSEVDNGTAQGWIGISEEKNCRTGKQSFSNRGNSTAKGLLGSNHVLGESWLNQKTSMHLLSLCVDSSYALHFSSACWKNCVYSWQQTWGSFLWEWPHFCVNTDQHQLVDFTGRDIYITVFITEIHVASRHFGQTEDSIVLHNDTCEDSNKVWEFFIEYFFLL